MKKFKLIGFTFFAAIFVLFQTVSFAASRTWTCKIWPKESKTVIDDSTGAKVIFVTTSKASDTNLYFHMRSFLSDGSMLLFYSNRTGRPELFGYLMKTGELVQLIKKGDPPVGNVTASIRGNAIYLIKQNAVFEWKVAISLKNDKHPTQVKITEKKICDLGKNNQIGGAAELTESCDSKYLATKATLKNGRGSGIFLINKATGDVKLAVTVDYVISHLQFSRTNPDLVMYAHWYKLDKPLSKEDWHSRMWLANVKTGVSWPLHPQAVGEYNTHECWWINDQVTFCGGYRDGHSPVRVIDTHTGLIRVIGEGAWWQGASASDLAKYNWWHASGDYQGRWVAADNWHGIIALFNGRTTQKRILTQGHRIYGHGKHPHVGWNHLGGMVEFTSNKFGNPDVCVAFIPKEWEK